MSFARNLRKSYYGHATQSRDIVLNRLLQEIILLSDGVIWRRSPKPASWPEVGYTEACRTRGRGARMCAVLHTSPHAVPRPRAVVACNTRSLAMLGAHSELSSRPVHQGFHHGNRRLGSNSKLPDESMGISQTSQESPRDTYRHLRCRRPSTFDVRQIG